MVYLAWNRDFITGSTTLHSRQVMNKRSQKLCS